MLHRTLKTCPYCGRPNEDARDSCAGCGTDLRQRDHAAEAGGVLDLSAPCRRCHCGGAMWGYKPGTDSSTFLRPFRHRYVCGGCGNRALVTPHADRPVQKVAFVVGCIAVVCLYFSHPLDGLQSHRKMRWVVFSIVFAVVGLTAGWIALVGAWNRRRYPIIDDPSETRNNPNTGKSR